MSQAPARPCEQWPTVLAEAARLLDDVVMVGHCTGGMFMLSCPSRWRVWLAGPAEAADAYGQDPNDGSKTPERSARRSQS
ncbi:hypothetical protein [Streptomyces massasporeus]|uniref:hypothetical protein n=1 Tax=Streptomyces massasporeus TaxID=67324 RepID=UPI0036CA5D78